MIAVINLNIDPQVKTSLKDLEAHQSSDPWVRKIKENLTKQPIPQTSDRLSNGMVQCKGHKSYTFWRPILPASLEKKNITFVHALLGHAASDKCIAQLANTFCIKNIGRKVRKIISW